MFGKKEKPIVNPNPEKRISADQVSNSSFVPATHRVEELEKENKQQKSLLALYRAKEDKIVQQTEEWKKKEAEVSEKDVYDVVFACNSLLDILYEDKNKMSIAGWPIKFPNPVE